MNINVIVAMRPSDRGIGFKGRLPWKHIEDLQRFARLTKGDGNNAIIMGRKTWESLPRQPLPKRQNIILSSTLSRETVNLKGDELYFTTLDAALHVCKIRNFDTVWIIGGEAIYKHAFAIGCVSKIYVTLVPDEPYLCDAFFPPIPSSFTLVSETESNDNNSLIKYQLYEAS